MYFSQNIHQRSIALLRIFEVPRFESVENILKSNFLNGLPFTKTFPSIFLISLSLKSNIFSHQRAFLSHNVNNLSIKCHCSCWILSIVLKFCGISNRFRLSLVFDQKFRYDFEVTFFWCGSVYLRSKSVFKKFRTIDTKKTSNWKRLINIQLSPKLMQKKRWHISFCGSNTLF